MALLIVALAACASPSDEPTAAPQPPARASVLPQELAGVADFCAVPGDTAAAAVPAGSRAVAIGAQDRLDIRYAPFPAAVRCTLRTRAQWEQLWKALDARDAPPSAPESGMVVLAAAGTISTEGHDIAIDGVWIHGDTATVSVRERTVGDGCAAGQLEAYPTAAVRIPAVPVVRFRETLLVGEPCF
ncbi:MAG: protease complex subunit PrcB family protein [Gemmatimonadetes bacterium]|nr:protease complex subunit PrcB family protein [Gemmatimonadota bacterium]